MVFLLLSMDIAHINIFGKYQEKGIFIRCGRNIRWDFRDIYKEFLEDSREVKITQKLRDRLYWVNRRQNSN